jgi:nondiscriminating glutamyl-tRNA synthetase
MSKKVRVRFAPSPTGFMHLGNIRTALFNYLFAKQKKGTFVLRIEDTDAARNVDEASLKIINDLKWLGIRYTEGPLLEGKCGPYLQSERTEIYQNHLIDLIRGERIYRCFCTPEELEAERNAQIAKKQPPRYSRKCLHLSADQTKEKISYGQSFIWRIKLNDQQAVSIKTLERGTIDFALKNFSDFALTRSDGSFTFLFANFIDDWLMKITHVIRGEDHLTNTAMQAALFDTLSIPMPVFFHLPMLCNQDGKKMSKRDFGFSLEDIKKKGFLPEAVCNYLATIGGSFKEEVQDRKELCRSIDFDNQHTTGAIHYDEEKLTWFNHQWIMKLPTEKLIKKMQPHLYPAFPEARTVDPEKLVLLVEKVKEELKTLDGIVNLVRFYFEAPQTKKADIESKIGGKPTETILAVIKKELSSFEKNTELLSSIKVKGKEAGLKTKEILAPLRYLLTGSFSGMNLNDLFEVLEKEKIEKRLSL